MYLFMSTADIKQQEERITNMKAFYNQNQNDRSRMKFNFVTTKKTMNFFYSQKLCNFKLLNNSYKKYHLYLLKFAHTLSKTVFWILQRYGYKWQDFKIKQLNTSLVRWVVGWLVGCVLWHINPHGLFNAKSCLYIYILKIIDL